MNSYFFVFIACFSFVLISLATEIPLDLAGRYWLTLEITSKISIPEKVLIPDFAFGEYF